MSNPNLVRKIVDNPPGGSGEGSLNDIFPPGMVIAFAGSVAPSGWVECNGAVVSRSVFARLFASIGTSHGSGDGSTTFNLPDYRGRFLRGVDGSASLDPDKNSRTAMASGGNTGNNVGSVQGDQFRSHKHDLFYGISETFEPVPTINGNANDNSGVSIMNTASIGNAGGSETRPLNAYVNYLIKV